MSSTANAPKPRLAEAIASLGDTVSRLSHLSKRSYQNPYITLRQWPEEVRPEEDWFSSPEYVSLYGTPLWDALDEPARRRLAFHEAVNFYSLNIHGEKGLMQGLAQRLYRKDLVDVSEYLHHFLDEENKHSIYFGGFCTRYAKVYRSRQFALEETRSQSVEDFLFFAKTMIFEEIVDRYNWVQARDARLHPVSRFINDNHHVEESRHLVFGRQLVTALWEACVPSWGDDTVADLRRQLEQFFVVSWREYYNPDVYADAGLDDPWEVAEQAWSAPAQRAHRRAVSTKVLAFLTEAGILDKEPADSF
ncbi:diiron oxygenase [Streptomyces sp. RKAG337]|uniref:diiron oxygenase n=1 Tax=Streptomyces sp. RKAG337 TaxID=2893404 RepID=UPI0020345A04|nr:diiron oxygenase [Streptomyces sp. RKAG337]MCM2430687.1 diiron oxygenase [Streptomyces sp. RKAG337]